MRSRLEVKAAVSGVAPEKIDRHPIVKLVLKEGRPIEKTYVVLILEHSLENFTQGPAVEIMEINGKQQTIF